MAMQSVAGLCWPAKQLTAAAAAISGRRGGHDCNVTSIGRALERRQVTCSCVHIAVSRSAAASSEQPRFKVPAAGSPVDNCVLLLAHAAVVPNSHLAAAL